MKPIARIIKDLYLFLAFALSLSLQAQVNLDPWIDSGYVRRVALTNISPAVPGQALSDFPVLVSLSNATWLDNLLADGGDITFAGSDGSQFFHEIEQFDFTTKTLVAWVCIPTLTNKTSFYMYWRNPGTLAFSGSNTSKSITGSLATLNQPFIASNTWDTNFLLVWHLAETNTMPKDSTRWTNHAYFVATNVTSNVSGIGNSRGLFSTSISSTANPGIKVKNITNATLKPLITNTMAMSISLWHKAVTYPSNATYMGTNIFNTGGTTATNQESVLVGFKTGSSTGSTDGRGVLSYNSQNQPTAYYQSRGGTVTSLGLLTNLANTFNTLPPPFDNWNYYALSAGVEIGKTLFQFNGGTTAAGTGSFTASGSIGELWVLGGETGGAGPYYRRNSPWGWTDELRLSLAVRSSNWLLTEYSNTLVTTNMPDYNGATSANVLTVSNAVAVTMPNLSGKVAVGVTFRGGSLAGTGILSNRLIISNSSGAEVYNAAVTQETPSVWSATPALPTGNYVATAVLTASNNVVTNAEPISFQIVTSSVLRVQTTTSSGAPWPTGRVQGPSGNGSTANEIRSNDAAGLAAFSNLYSGDTITLINYTPILWGGVAATTNILMPESNASITWILDSAWTALDPNSNASGKLDSVYFIGSQSPTLKLSVAQASKATQRVVIEACPLYGGRRVGIFDGIVTSSDPVARIEGSDLRRLIKPGIWVLEFRSPPTGQDASQAPVNRRLLFYAQ